MTSCELCRSVALGSVCTVCPLCGMHHEPESEHANMERDRAHYRCLRCGHSWAGLSGPTKCPQCRHEYVEWTDREAR